MKVLVDTNVVLDLLLDRAPYAGEAAALFALVEHNVLAGCLGATTLTTIHYLAAKAVGRTQAMEQIRVLLRLFDIAPVNRAVLEAAAAADGFGDYEDAVLHEAARLSGADALVTRNQTDFGSGTLPVYGPGELLSLMGAQGQAGGPGAGLAP